MTVVLTHHALDRIKARTNFSPTRAQEIAEEAYYCGKDLDDFPKQIRKYFENVLQASSGDTLKILGNDIYLFGNGHLITVFPFPKKVVQNKKKKGEKNDRFKSIV